ncbi:phosphatidylinositol 3,4,5-trisphosphate 3-phosphatase and protein-tyrosine-phosphatase PTEN1 [Salvia miltiorrhiza]|uniref:phosphatidylinositol 3,4,5-trisphosphate 3-phosphatase and protein-tyrosine-phosphatase PTEN1 n=1 Tax=Salvia miltiorrhiza TaxID=226208 RepID=UPI0025ACAA1F|nr:phosphatidylinositol 3,4,5-trisphosphate 3-phosphatase and protein-tyrosine-phosphatase PTEN1 [Salvia miltiorrhiza]XP_057769651.1 phosphatidylinositol 3,4,5-trisphosphate 3-phosphatase and protein-tyrosine-phosphatase PTEN1 [Salvia miltiorrhiza]XP_057769652.1 phosphatidylinositol 3,4,5-trisphosphate 3-phosphatase and protein-tyrosine-phosphatase PTEN1 [Salvia miltiorrhiza]
MGLKMSKKGQKSPESSMNVRFVRSQLVSCLWKNYIRNLVSKKRRRLLVDGYDLDMTYITDRILAMSFPAERMRAMYRNPLWQVKSVLEMKHRGHYKVYNLCIEEDYDPLHFNGCVERFPFDDNHVPPLSMVKDFCQDVHSWLATDPKNIAVVHCMAGKGRTGLMVSCYLVYTGMPAEKALHLYAERRTTNNEGVSIASQRRYVAYWEKTLSHSNTLDLASSPYVNLPQPCTRELQHIRLYDAANISQVFVVVSELQEIAEQRYRPSVEVSKTCCRRIGTDNEKSYESRYYYSFVDRDGEGKKDADEEPRLVVQMDTESSIIYQKTCLGHHYEKPLRLTGDVRVIFYEKLIGGRLFYVCFNTAFITGSLLQFSIRDLDKVGQKGRSICGPSFCLELFFGPSNANCLMPANDF